MRRGITITAVAVAVSLLALAGAACAQDPTDPKTVERIAAEAIDVGKLQKRGELRYAPNRSDPYSGWAVKYYDPETFAQAEGNEALPIRVLHEYVDGKFSQILVWHENGQMKEKNRYVDNKLSSYTFWHENGQMRAKRDQDGSITSWRENGEISSQGNNLNGQVTAWYENGDMSSQTDYVDGQARKTLKWHENGQMSAKHSWKADYIKHGSWAFWNEKGQIIEAGPYVDGKKHGLWTTSYHIIGERGLYHKKKCYENDQVAFERKSMSESECPF